MNRMNYLLTYFFFNKGVPSNLPSAEELKESIRNKFAQYVINIHELHIWNLEPNHILCSLHVTYENFEVGLMIELNVWFGLAS